ncbi:fish-egg lectin-like [Aplochiton taeniatus]
MSGNNWQPLPDANLKHVTVGPAGTWGVDNQDQILKLVGGSWVVAPAPGRLKQLDAGGASFVVGNNAADSVYCLGSAVTNGYSGGPPLPWLLLPGLVKYLSCGPNGCWGVNSANEVFIMRTVNPVTCENSGWEFVSGLALIMIEVATDGSIFGVNQAGELYQRSGVTASNPVGTEWDKVSLCLGVKHVTYDLGLLWVVTTGGFAMACTH